MQWRDAYYQKWRATRPEAITELEQGADGTSSLEEAAEASTFEEAEETAWGEIEQYVQAMNPYDLQKLVAALLRAMGYHVSWIAPPGPDKGIDILAHSDALGTSTPRIKVQVKRRADRIRVEGIRSFMAEPPHLSRMTRNDTIADSGRDAAHGSCALFCARPQSRTIANGSNGRERKFACTGAKNQHHRGPSHSVVIAIPRTHNPQVPGSSPGGRTNFGTLFGS